MGWFCISDANETMKNLLNKPYDLLESKTFRYWFIVGAVIFGILFLWMFEPYGLYNLTTLHAKILAVGLYVGSGLVILIIQFLLLQNVFIRKYTLGITICWITLSFLAIGTSSTIVNSFLFDHGRFRFAAFIYFQGAILSINIIPVSIFVLVHYNVTLQKRLRVASQLNKTLTKREQSPENNQQIVLNSENKNEGFVISMASLLYITSLDNYIDVYYLKNKLVEHKLIRYSLASVEEDNKNRNEIFRCHKSYLVNKSMIQSVSGNAAGYKIKLHDCDTQIPVSRKWNKTLSVLLSK